MNKPALVLVLCGLLACLEISAQSFSTPEELNQYIESNWSKKELRKDLYNQALKGVTQFSQNGELWGRVGFLEYMMDMDGFGEEKIDKALNLAPDNSFVRIWAYNIYHYKFQQETNLEKACLILLKAIKADPSYTGEVYYALGVRYMNAEQLAKAIEYFDLAEKNGYMKDNLYADRGNAHKNMGHCDLSAQDLDKALKINPRNTWALYVYAYLESYRGNPEGFIRRMEEILQFKDDEFSRQQDKNIRQWLGETYSRVGDFSQAEKYYQSLISNYREDSSVANWKDSLFHLSNKSITISYSITADTPNVTVLLPARNSFQTYINLSITPKPTGQEIFTHRGNTYGKLTYPKAPGKIQIQADMMLSMKSIKREKFQETLGDVSWNDFTSSTIFGGNVKMNPSEPYLKALVKEIVGNETDDLEKARKIHQWIIKNFTYKVVYFDTLEEYFQTKTGECGGYALVFVSLARAAGIPARRAFSPFICYPTPTALGSHETSEFYSPQWGWVPINNTSDVFGSTSSTITLWVGEDAEFDVKDLKDFGLKSVTGILNRDGKVLTLTAQ